MKQDKTLLKGKMSTLGQNNERIDDDTQKQYDETLAADECAHYSTPFDALLIANNFEEASSSNLYAEPIYQSIDEVKPLSVKRRSIHIKLDSLESVSTSSSSSYQTRQQHHHQHCHKMRFRVSN